MFKNTIERYGLVAIFFHWIMAVLIIAMISLGLYMTGLPVSPQKLKLYRWHKEVGVVILILAFLRLSWRLRNIVPAQSLFLPHWQTVAAKTVHYTLYAAIILLPITGWLATSAAGFSVSFFGWFVLPNLISPNETLRIVLIETHHWLGFIIIGLILLHVGATLQHFVIYKENLLKRIWP